MWSSSSSKSRFGTPTVGGGFHQNEPPALHVDLQKVPVRVDIVNLDGVCRTKDDYVQGELKDMFKASNFEQLVVSASLVQQKLERMGCFRKVGILIDTNKKDGATEHGYEVTFAAQEIGRFVGSINTLAGANSGSLIFGLRLPNFIGRGEKVLLEHTISTSEDRGTSVTFSKPFLSWNSEFGVTFFKQKVVNPYSSYNMHRLGSLLDFAFESAQNVKHNMQWEGEWRHLDATSRNTTMPIREQSGQTFKSVIRHILTVDHRDQPIFPSVGVYLKLVQEFAGVAGDVAYVKHDSHLQVNIPLLSDLVLQGSLRLGIFRPLEAKFQTHNVHDLFFLGGPCGPTTLRGFQMRSIGPRHGHDMLGGQTYWTSGLHLYAPLPFRLGQGSFGEFFRSHLFLSAGNILENSLNTEDLGEGFKSLLSNFRASCGFGLAMRIGQSARIELNYCWPLRYYRGDKIVTGIQFGLGVEF